MTTEKDFWRLLRKNHWDFQTMGVFADWLQERGDNRAAGMRALGRFRIVPDDGTSIWRAEQYSPAYTFPWTETGSMMLRGKVISCAPAMIPAVWFNRASPRAAVSSFCAFHTYQACMNKLAKTYPTEGITGGPGA